MAGQPSWLLDPPEDEQVAYSSDSNCSPLAAARMPLGRGSVSSGNWSWGLGFPDICPLGQ